MTKQAETETVLFENIGAEGEGCSSNGMDSDSLQGSDFGDTTQSTDSSSESGFAESRCNITVLQDFIEERWLTLEHCDFLSDFGRSEPFLLDGDSLIMYAMSNKHLDWRNGGQFLHLVYIVEQFLAQLWSRGANFDIFFLMGNEAIFRLLGPSYELGRNIVVNHLRYYETEKKIPFKLHFISDTWFSASQSISTSWQELVVSYRPAFIMTNNVRTGPELVSIAQRWFFHQQLLQGLYSVVLENIGFEGSRVKGFLYNYPDPSTSKKIKEMMTSLEDEIDQQWSGQLSSGSVFSKSCEMRSGDSCDAPDIHAAIPLSRISIFVESLREILASSICTSLTKGLAAVSCVCMHILQINDMTVRGIVLPGDMEGKPALEALDCSSTVAREATTFLDTLYSHMSNSIRHAVAHGQHPSNGTLADIFDGRLFSAFILSSVASGGYLSKGIAEGGHALILSAWPPGAGNCPPLHELLQALAEGADLEAARAALADAAKMRSTVTSVTLLPASGTLLKEVLGDLVGRLAPYESKDSLPQAASSAGPFRAHHYHSTRPLENEPDSFSYSVWDDQRGVNAVAQRRNEYWLRKQKRKHLLQLQLKARAATRYQESLIAGSLCQRQTISQKLSKEELEERRVRALELLRADGTLKLASGGEGKERKEKKTQRRVEKQRAAAAAPTKKEKIIQDNLVAQRRKMYDKEISGFEGYKSQLSRIKDKEVAQYLAKMEEFANKCDAIALFVRMHCLETAVKGCPRSSRQKTVYLTAQRILRQHLAELTKEDRAVIAGAVLDVGFTDLHVALLGVKARARADSGGDSSVLFQLEQVPEYLLRPAGDGTDCRVQFPPDKWQRRLLDVVDSGNSALVVAPTASGKTFISYYVMEMCLRAGDDDVVVYVAPTKALVNQVRAEIDARFDKSYRGSRKLSATFTRDFRDDNMLAAQILVTVPACLGILVLSNVEWASRIRHVIFDEVHCLGDSGGEIWEQLILLIESPFLALSATIGNTQRFHAWLSKVEATRGREVVLVEHYERYNDLSTWLWGKKGLTALNPCWVLQKVRMGRQLAPEMIPKDLRLLPEHCAALYRQMGPFLPKDTARALDPEVFFRGLCGEQEVLWDLSMRQVAAWERALKQALCELQADTQDNVLNSLSRETSATFKTSDGGLAALGERKYVRNEITSLIQCLKNSDMLPCICFMLDRQGCERLALTVTMELRELEAQQREKNGWAAKRDRLRTERDEALQRYRKCKEKALILSTGEIIDARKDLYDRYVELHFQVLRHLQPDPEFSVSSICEDDIEDAFGKLREGECWTDLVSPGLRAALCRGIGVHHAGMTLKYRQAVERLFRAKRLGVIFATSTLALGINMPAKSSVFVSDAVYLNAMNFRQMAGRAGRRGFDLRGNVVFLGMPSTKCFRLMRSDLPTLQGNLVLNNSMALRLIIRQSALASLRLRDGEAYLRGVRACWRLVNLPLFNPMSSFAAAGGGMMGQQMAHAFRFSVEYLQRTGLIRVDDSGEIEPNDLAGFIAHLYFMEPSNFAFVSLLLADEGRLFKSLCLPVPDRDERVLSVLCHIFCRTPLPASIAARARQRVSTSGPSIVLLPELDCIGDLLKGPDGEMVPAGSLVRHYLHDENALRSLEAYCACFVAAHSAELGNDNTLPVSGYRLRPTLGLATMDQVPELAQLALRPQVRSAFVALSGHGDRFSSVAELCETLRAGLYLDPKMVPVFELLEASVPLNAFILDFFKHGQLEALVRYNRIRRDAIWDELFSFALVLKALHAAMARRAEAGSAGRPTPFADSNVLEALGSISRRFNEALQKSRA